ncbi:MAG: ribosome biogenesis GTP-binding protein YihA/YsxC [Acidobacteriota bacterium]
MEIRSVVLHRAAYRPEDFPSDGRPQFAMIGRSNVGKSTVINALVKRKGVARTSQTPGKTQAIHFYLINDRFYIVDLPGYGYARVPKTVAKSWGLLIRTYLDGAEFLRTIFLLLDSRRIPSPEDLMMRDWMNEAGVHWRAILTKVDKLSKNELAAAKKNIRRSIGEEQQPISFSKMTGEGVDEIWRELFAGMEKKGRRDGEMAARAE